MAIVAILERGYDGAHFLGCEKCDREWPAP